MKIKFIWILSLILMLSSSVILSEENVTWDYTQDAGPEKWGELDSRYELCTSGKNQSPIDITGTYESELPDIQIQYDSKIKHIKNNGHTIKVTMEPGSHISVSGKIFNLLQIHFHSLSENTINGKHFPLEAHFVHADEHGNLGVIGVMFEESYKKNKHLEKIWEVIPEEGATVQLEKSINLMKLLPKDKDYFRFNGSLTTPPCSEGVTWMVMQDPVHISKKQIKRYQDIFKHYTHRPVQPMNARIIIEN